MATELLGRNKELERLQAALRRTTEGGEPTLVLVRGQPGIGKTTLLKAFADRADDESGRPLVIGYGQAMTNALGSDAFQAMRECLRSLVARTERSSSKETLGRVVGAVRTHAPDWLESVPVVGLLLAAGVKTGMTATRAVAKPSLDSRLDQLISLVRELFRSGPVLLILDDLHWADVATIEILMALALKIDGPLMLVLSYRSDDLRPATDGEPHPLARAVFRLRRYNPSCCEIELSPLSIVDTLALIRSASSGRSIDEMTVHQLARESAGVPLFAESLGEIYGRGATANAADGKFRQITAVVEERLSFASIEDQRLLEAALAIGFTFEVDFLAVLVRCDVDEVYDRLDTLMREHHLIVEAEPAGSLDRYALAHPLLAQVLKFRVDDNGTRWRRYQQKLVDIFLGQKPSDELAVRVAVAAAAASDPRAAALNFDAAQRQYRAGAVTKARELASTALAEARDSGASSNDVFDACDLLARCLSAEANHREAAIVCEEALSTTPSNDLVQIQQLKLMHARCLRMITQWGAAERSLNELTSNLGNDTDPIRCEILLLQAELALCGPVQDTNACIALCNSVAGMTENIELLSRAYGHRGLAHLAAYHPGEAEAWLHAAIDVAKNHVHPYAAYEALHWLSKKKIACLELEDAWSALMELTDMSESSGVAQDSPFHRRDASRVLALQGDASQAALEFIQYFDDLDAYQDQDRALTVLVCQVAEIDSLFGHSAGDELLDAITKSGHPRATPTAAQARLADSIRGLHVRQSGLDAVDYAVAVVGVAANEARASEAIFRFDVPDLAKLRRLVTDA